MIVVDASMTIAWLFRSQCSEGARSALRRATTDGATAPSIWRLEVANVLRTSIRRGRCTEEYATGCLERLSRLRVEVDPETDRHAWGVTRELSRTHDLTPYDAAYLELALRFGHPIASLDIALLNAAYAEGLETLRA